MEDLGFLGDQNKILVLALPKDNKSIIVHYDNGYGIYVTLPAKSRTIAINDYGEEDYDEDEIIPTLPLEIKCPNLIWHSHYADTPKFKHPNTVTGHSVYVHNPEVTDRIQACPYLMPNVHATGQICFGGLGVPFSPREAFNAFWKSPFNADLQGEALDTLSYDEDSDAYLDIGFESSDVNSYIEFYHKEGLDLQPWHNYTTQFLGTRYWASPEGSDALLLSDSAKLLRQIPRKFWRKNAAGNPFIVARAHDHRDHWEFISGGFCFKLDAGFITQQARYNPQVGKLKKQFGTLPKQQLPQHLQAVNAPTNSTPSTPIT
jgi:hypothetical protein